VASPGPSLSIPAGRGAQQIGMHVIAVACSSPPALRAGGRSGREIDRDGFHRRVVVTCEHLVSAFGLALECNLGRKCPPSSRALEQSRRA
jgi:hypothetical protein